NVTVFEVLDADIEALAAAQVHADATVVGHGTPAHAIASLGALEGGEGIRTGEIRTNDMPAHGDEFFAREHEFAQAKRADLQRVGWERRVPANRAKHDAGGLFIEARAPDRAIPAFSTSAAGQSAFDGSVPATRAGQITTLPASDAAGEGNGNGPCNRL